MRVRHFAAAVALAGVLFGASGCSSATIAEHPLVTVTGDSGTSLSELVTLDDAQDYSG